VTPEDVALVVAATGAAGAANALAGGGSLLSFPAIVAAGIDPVRANVSNTLALWPGYLGGAATLRARTSGIEGLRVLVPAAAIGAAVGSVLLLVGDADTFEAIVPFLVLLASALLAVPKPWLERARSSRIGRRTSTTVVAVGLAGVYGAYFGGGLGVILLAVLNASLGFDLHDLNGVKATLALLVNTVALVAFVSFGPVEWWVVAVGAPASLAGGVLGASVADRVPVHVLRRVVVAFGVAAGIGLLVT
jgi:uncharacterized membrane protein YfcA